MEPGLMTSGHWNLGVLEPHPIAVDEVPILSLNKS